MPARHSWELLDFLEKYKQKYKPPEVAAHDLDDDIRDEENEPIHGGASADDNDGAAFESKAFRLRCDGFFHGVDELEYPRRSM